MAQSTNTLEIIPAHNTAIDMNESELNMSGEENNQNILDKEVGAKEVKFSNDE